MFQRLDIPTKNVAVLVSLWASLILRLKRLNPLWPEMALKTQPIMIARLEAGHHKGMLSIDSLFTLRSGWTGKLELPTRQSVLAPIPLGTSGLWLAALAVLVIGLSKAGFGGGLGMLTTPLCVVAFGPENAIGILLPLLCAGDAFSLYHYWKKWRIENLKYLLPGIIIGVLCGVRLFGRFSPRELNIIIGGLAVSFVIFQLVKETIFKAEGAFQPNHTIGFPFGIGAGMTSTFAHGAGPVVSLFLIPQRMPKELYVGTTVLIFCWINWIKFPFFVGNGLITAKTLSYSLYFFPLVPIGVWLGVWLNRRISDIFFNRLIYAFTFLTGLQLIFNFRFGAPTH